MNASFVRRWSWFTRKFIMIVWPIDASVTSDFAAKSVFVAVFLYSLSEHSQADIVWAMTSKCNSKFSSSSTTMILIIATNVCQLPRQWTIRRFVGSTVVEENIDAANLLQPMRWRSRAENVEELKDLQWRLGGHAEVRSLRFKVWDPESQHQSLRSRIWTPESEHQIRILSIECCQCNPSAESLWTQREKQFVRKNICEMEHLPGSLWSFGLTARLTVGDWSPKCSLQCSGIRGWNSSLKHFFHAEAFSTLYSVHVAASAGSNLLPGQCKCTLASISFSASFYKLFSPLKRISVGQCDLPRSASRSSQESTGYSSRSLDTSSVTFLISKNRTPHIECTFTCDLNWVNFTGVTPELASSNLNFGTSSQKL